MHPFQFKIKGYFNETGEYTEFFPADPGTILQFIIQHWFNESLPNNLDCIVIKNNQGDRLIIDHLKRDIFDYYFLPAAAKRKYFHVKTDIQLMFFLLESFFGNRLEDVQENLREKVDDWEFVRGDLSGKNFLYKINREGLWKNLSWLGYQLAFMAVFLIASIFVHPILLLIVLIFTGLALAANYSKIKMYREYYFDNRFLEVTISRGNDQIVIRKGAWTRAVPKTEIRKLTRFVPPPDDAHAQADYYLEVEFLNGDVLNLTSLLIGQADADGKFMHNLIPFEVEVAENGLLNRKTDLSHYFSAIGLR
jgi:hypothetical protein